MAIDYRTINEAILALVSQAVLEGFRMRSDRSYSANNDLLNERREEILALIQSEVEADRLLTKA